MEWRLQRQHCGLVAPRAAWPGVSARVWGQHDDRSRGFVSLGMLFVAGSEPESRARERHLRERFTMKVTWRGGGERARRRIVPCWQLCRCGRRLPSWSGQSSSDPRAPGPARDNQARPPPGGHHQAHWHTGTEQHTPYPTYVRTLAAGAFF